MLKKVSALIVIASIIVACTPSTTEKTGELKKDTAMPVGLLVVDSTRIKKDTILLACSNDSLNALANVMSGIKDSATLFNFIQTSHSFQAFNTNFDKRWMAFDSTRLMKLRAFRDNEISKEVTNQSILFYPFSGPDILYSQTFFPKADRYVMIGLESVGSLPEFSNQHKDSLSHYFSKINTSLNAILNYSFFRTQSMKNDLHNTEVDGTLHLLFLFLKRTGNQLCSAKPLIIDSLGNTVFLNSFDELKKIKSNTKGVEIKFTDINKNHKTLNYFALNAADGGLKSNKGFVTYLNGLGTVNTYLKGASYLMHKSYFSIIRNIILNQSNQVIQDDSGIALHYFTTSSSKWKYKFYGNYIKPIPMFSGFYQKDLDSLYKGQGANPIGFGIGYNFKDKNSNFMIATKQL